MYFLRIIGVIIVKQIICFIACESLYTVFIWFNFFAELLQGCFWIEGKYCKIFKLIIAHDISVSPCILKSDMSVVFSSAYFVMCSMWPFLLPVNLLFQFRTFFFLFFVLVFVFVFSLRSRNPSHSTLLICQLSEMQAVNHSSQKGVSAEYGTPSMD